MIGWRSAPQAPSRARARRWACHAAAILGLALLPCETAASAGRSSKLAAEYDLKAAFLFNFVHFVEWPPDAFAAAEAPFVIGILGQDPFGSILDELVAQETVHERRIVIRRYQTVGEVAGCQILFVGGMDSGQVDHALSSLARSMVLTVGETRAFTAHSGMIAFEVARRRLHLCINLAAVTDARLTVSSKLLRQAEIVGPVGRTP